MIMKVSNLSFPKKRRREVHKFLAKILKESVYEFLIGKFVEM